MQITLTMIDDEGDEYELRFPARWVVCHDCEGEGYVLNEGMRGVAYSREEFEQTFDYEEQEQYFTRGGIYDVQCPTCCGRTTVQEVDEERLTSVQREQYAVYQKYEEEVARSRAADARTMRMESGEW